MVTFRYLFAALLLGCAGPAIAAAAPATAPAAASATPAAQAAPIGHPLEKADAEAWLDGFIPYALDRGDVAGAVVMIVKDGEILVAKGYGHSDVGTHAPVDPQTTMFRPGSVSKLLTWTAVMQMVEQGKVNLDHDVNEYLDFKIPSRNDGPITLRNILTHTAGFEEQIKALIIDDPKDFVDLETYVKGSTPKRIFKAGTTPAYSNYATALAGYIIQRVSGQSFDDYVDAHIFKPLDMQHSSFRQPLPASLVPYMSKGYPQASLPAKPYELVIPAPAGSLASSGVDMAHFMIAHLEGGAYHDGRILSPETAKLMHETPLTIIAPLNRMELGFYEQNYNGHRVISHGGDTQYMHSYLHLLLDDHVGLYISVNSAGKDGAAHAIRAALFDSFFDRYFPAARAPATVDAKTAAEHAAMLAGQYDVSRRPDTSFMSVLGLVSSVKMVVKPDGTIGGGMMKDRSGADRIYHEIEPFVWREDSSGWRLAAKVENGRVTRFSSDEISPFMVFEPTPWWRSNSWLQPAAGVAFVALLLTTLLWPVAAITRRRLGVSVGLTGVAARGRLVSRIAAVAVSAISIAWITVIGVGMSKMGFLGPAIDPLLYLLYACSVLCYIGGAAAMAWSAYVAFTAGRTWTARLWTAVLALSAAVLLWVAVVYHLMSFATSY